MAFPATIDSPGGTAAQGTNLLTSPDHSQDHRTLGSAVIAIETFLGTNSASNGQFSSFTSGQTPVPINSGTLGTTISSGTFNNGVFGGGTANGILLGTAATEGAFNNGTLAGTGNGTTNGTINWANGDLQYLTLGTSGTIAYSNQGTWKRLTLVVYQNATGGYALTLPTSKYSPSGAPTFGTTANQANAIVVIFDGTTNLTQSAVSFS